MTAFSERYCHLGIVCLCLALAAAGLTKEKKRMIIPAKSQHVDVTPDIMQSVYDRVKTPFKYGIVLRGENDHKVDCPCVFRHENRWYMTYIIFDGNGYETALAVSDDLLHWQTCGKMLPFRSGTWDALQAAGSMALQDYRWNGTFQIAPFAGKYWMSYLGGALQGYETDPLSIGMAWNASPIRVDGWTRTRKPVLSRDQEDVREFEKMTLYRSNVIWDKEKKLGYPFVMFYNGKVRNGYERIGMAVSEDMLSWQRYGSEHVIDNGEGISGDPQIVRIGDIWVMLYFGAFWKPKAFDTFACSHDLVHWTKWTGQDLIAPSEPWDDTYAHKPWVVIHDGIVYHFYCAVGSEGRVIALATSQDLKGQ
jgi:predicted GH43/DUF377 family glycosyl hydrolase